MEENEKVKMVKVDLKFKIKYWLSNLVRVRDILFFVLGMLAALVICHKVYQWRMDETVQQGSMVYKAVNEKGERISKVYEVKWRAAQ
jgi:hypothetical protein